MSVCPGPKWRTNKPNYILYFRKNCISIIARNTFLLFRKQHFAFFFSKLLKTSSFRIFNIHSDLIDVKHGSRGYTNAQAQLLKSCPEIKMGTLYMRRNMMRE